MSISQHLLSPILQSARAYQNILWFQISVADSRNSVYISQPPKYLEGVPAHSMLGKTMNTQNIDNKSEHNPHNPYLVHVKFNIDKWHSLIRITIVLQNSIHGLRDIFHNQVEKKFIFTCC